MGEGRVREKTTSPFEKTTAPRGRATGGTLPGRVAVVSRKRVTVEGLEETTIDVVYSTPRVRMFKRAKGCPCGYWWDRYHV